MIAWLVLLTTGFLDLPPLEVELLSGEVHRGTLARLTAEGVTLQENDAEATFNSDSLLEIRWQAPPSTLMLPPLVVTLADGSRVSCTQYRTQRGQATLEGPYGTLEFPASQVANVRFGPGTESQSESWDRYLERTGRDDTLVTQSKDGSLDRLTGVIGDVQDGVQFLIDGDELTVKREKLHGLIYRKRELARRSGDTLLVTLLGGDFLKATSAAWDGMNVKVTLLAGAAVSIPPDRLRSIDFSSGKVRYLSQDAPREVSAVSIWGNTRVPGEKLGNYFRRDRTRHYTSFSLDRKEYRRGLFFFPDTTARFRLGGEYTRLKALVGIDDREASDDYGDARLTIQGDSRVLLEATIKRGEPPRPIDVDVDGVRDLIISVTHGAELDTGDFVDLVDARVLK